MFVGVLVMSASSADLASAAIGDISTAAGTGSQFEAVNDGGPATAAGLDTPRGITSTPDGGFLVTDQEHDRVRYVSPAGTITTVAGDGTTCSPTTGPCGDGGPATQAQLNSPRGVELTADGGYLIADTNSHRVRKVSAAGIITTVAGDGNMGFGGDGGPATQARLQQPFGVAAMPDGSFLIADSENNRIRRVSADGIITTAAGDGAPRYAGDEGPATSASLNNPTAVLAGGGGTFLIADTFNHAVRVVLSDGRIRTMAGTGVPGYSGDGGDAEQANLQGPSGLARMPDGSLLIADAGNRAVRRVSQHQTITTVAGNGIECVPPTAPCGDGRPATAAQMVLPVEVAETADGGFLIVDHLGSRVRRVQGIEPPVHGCPLNNFQGVIGGDELEGLEGAEAADIIVGGGGNDSLHGFGGDDCLYGQQGGDFVAGDGGSDRLFGGVGRDLLRGYSGRDQLNGGPAADHLRGGPGADRIRCGGGRDVVRLRGDDRVARSCERVRG